MTLLFFFSCSFSWFLPILGLPENFQSRDYKPPSEVPCVIKILCDKHQGLHLEAKGIKEHWWKPYIRKLFSKKVGSSL